MKNTCIIRVIAMVVIVLILLGILVMFVACTPVEGSETCRINVPATFTIVRETKIQDRETYVIVHVETGVLYLWMPGSYMSGLTVMLDADGTPLLYEDYVK